MIRRLLWLLAIIAAMTAVPSPLGTLASPPPSHSPSVPEMAADAPPGLAKIEHIIILFQENRSFDHYFGTYPGADGIPRKADGTFAVCLQHPVLRKCVKPYHSTNLNNQGGPHGQPHARLDINGGKMNGFIRAVLLQDKYCPWHPYASRCDPFVGPQRQPDVMSFHTRADIPNYWAWADHFVLQDRMFESVDSWSVPSHLYLISAWSAVCKDASRPMTCSDDSRMAGASNIHAGPPPEFEAAYGWTDITDLLHEAGVDWRYYVGDGSCLETPCGPKPPSGTPWGWNPLPAFDTVRINEQVGNVQEYARFLEDAAAGTLPPVAWVIPGSRFSEHPGHGSLEPGYRYLTRTVDALMQSTDWANMAIFITWDDWGGFYDHVEPPRIEGGADYGLRVPGLMLSPYARAGYIDHQTLSYDAYLKFIEDRFLGGARLDPETMSRPDPRPLVREDLELLGDLTSEFDFDQEPLPPLVLSPDLPG